jgi:hypothetical protein
VRLDALPQDRPLSLPQSPPTLLNWFPMVSERYDYAAPP